MATPDSIGTSECHHCGHQVFIRMNSGGFAYYRCEQCGIEFRHHIMRVSEEYLRGEVKLRAIGGKPADGAKPAKPGNAVPSPMPAPPAAKPDVRPSLRTLLDQVRA